MDPLLTSDNIDNTDNTDNIEWIVHKDYIPSYFTSSIVIISNNPILPNSSLIPILCKFKTVIFGDDFNQNIDNLPDSIQYITTGARFNTIITKIPESLLSLIFHHYSLYNYPLIFNQSSKKLRKIILGYDFNQSIDTFPDHIETITFTPDSSFDQQIIKLPANLKHLSLPLDYQSTIMKFPNGLIDIEINSNLNGSINYLPASVRKIQCNMHFGGKLDYLPYSLHTLLFMGALGRNIYINYGNRLDKLPYMLSELELPSNYNFVLNNLPINLQYIDVGIRYNKLIDNLPPNVKILHFNDSAIFDKPLNKLPISLTEINFGMYFNNNIFALQSLNNLVKLCIGNISNLDGNLPDSILYLELIDDYNYSVEHLPCNLKSLVLHGNFNQPINSLPDSLECLNLKYCNFNRVIYKLPRNLQKLLLGSKFNQPFEECKGILDAVNLKILKIGYVSYNWDNTNNTSNTCISKGRYNYAIDNTLPDGLEFLSISGNFDQPITILPKNINSLELTMINYSYASTIPYLDTIKHIYICENCNYKNNLKEIYGNKVIENNSIYDDD